MSKGTPDFEFLVDLIRQATGGCVHELSGWARVPGTKFMRRQCHLCGMRIELADGVPVPNDAPQATRH